MEGCGFLCEIDKGASDVRVVGDEIVIESHKA